MTRHRAAQDSALASEEQEQLARRYRRIRAFSEVIAAPLTPEDCVIQSMPDVSPTRWHLAHTTWFFETFLLRELPGFRPYDESFDYLFNSYYNAVGKQFPRSKRGLLSRPTVEEVLEYRLDVDRRVIAVLESNRLTANQRMVIEIGLNHEQQHQELMLTDIKHVLSCNPLSPCYAESQLSGGSPSGDWNMLAYEGGLRKIGHDGAGFAYDNETPRHQVLLNSFEMADRLVTNGEYAQFMADGGYENPVWWLSLGWQTAQQEGWKAPLYWQYQDGRWWHFTLSGLHPVSMHLPVCHVSYFEADAYARWSGMRLPSEMEWEIASMQVPIDGNFADLLFQSHRTIHPMPVVERGRNGEHVDAEGSRREARQMFGDAWEWTHSPYMAYPGYAPAEGALGEYNGKFMCNQFVLRGGSCASPSGHLRRTYRNFFPPEARWQFSGIRLARDSHRSP